jgi:hypothetical protein
MRVWKGGNIGVADIERASKLDAAANAAAAITISGVSNRIATIHTVAWSYSDTPTGGKLTLTGGNVNYEVDITASGPGVLDLDYAAASDGNVTITLAAGGGTVVGKVNAKYSYEPA